MILFFILAPRQGWLGVNKNKGITLDNIIFIDNELF